MPSFYLFCYGKIPLKGSTWEEGLYFLPYIPGYNPSVWGSQRSRSLTQPVRLYDFQSQEQIEMNACMFIGLLACAQIALYLQVPGLRVTHSGLDHSTLIKSQENTLHNALRPI